MLRIYRKLKIQIFRFELQFLQVQALPEVKKDCQLWKLQFPLLAVLSWYRKESRFSG